MLHKLHNCNMFAGIAETWGATPHQQLITDFHSVLQKLVNGATSSTEAVRDLGNVCKGQAEGFRSAVLRTLASLTC